MRKCKILIIAVLVALLVSACGGQEASEGAEHMSDDPNSSTWQEQYDLGVRYLSEGNYEEAILAFTTAIEIDPKQASAYMGRSNAYVLSGETEENLSAAKADYEKAIELDETNADVYLGLADVYIRQGDYEKALEALKQGVEKAEKPQGLVEKISEIENRPQYNSYGAVEFTKRSEYCEASVLSNAEVQLLENLAISVIAGDHEQFLSLMQTDLPFTSFYTVWNNYKVFVHFSPKTVDEGNLCDWIEVVFRAENGMGYYGTAYSVSAIETEGRDHWWDYYQNTTIIACPCVDWQWNGRFESREYRHSFWRGIDTIGIYQGEDSTSETYEDTISSGEIVMGLRDGLVTENRHEVEFRNHGESLDKTSVATFFYKDGILVEENGEPWDGGKGYQLINDPCGTGGRSYPNNQLFLDELYW